MIKFILLNLLTIFVIKANAAALNASQLKLKVYKLAVSTEPNCSNPTTVLSNSNPSYEDFKGNPTLGSGSLADGTYPCVIIEFSDNIKITPDSTVGLCDSTVEQTQDVCQPRDMNGDSDTNDPGETPTSTLIDGSTANCTAGDDRVAMYLTTAAIQSQGDTDAFNPPDCNTALCDNDNGFNLAQSLVVSGTAVGKFLVDTDGKVCNGNDGFTGGNCQTDPGGQSSGNVCACEDSSACNMLPPNFSFSQQ